MPSAEKILLSLLYCIFCPLDPKDGDSGANQWKIIDTCCEFSKVTFRFINALRYSRSIHYLLGSAEQGNLS